MFQDFRLKVFAAVAEAGSFTKAAERLGISQAAVSQNISLLESKTGVRLFDRLHREVVLTKAGRVLLGYVRNILKACSEADIMFAELDQLTVTVSVSEDIFTTYLIPVLADFLTVHPDVILVRSEAGDHDLSVYVVPSSIPGKNSSVEFLYKPTQAFACTKTCVVLRKILGF